MGHAELKDEIIKKKKKAWRNVGMFEEERKHECWFGNLRSWVIVKAFVIQEEVYRKKIKSLKTKFKK